jgi:hypothetical protein
LNVLFPDFGYLDLGVADHHAGVSSRGHKIVPQFNQLPVFTVVHAKFLEPRRTG